MKILYGVQATGNGHISRSREVLTALKKAGHDVEVIFSGRPAEQLWGVESFKPFTVYRGFTFVVSRGRINIPATLCNLRPLQLRRDIAAWRGRAFDLVITDFEPVSARIARQNHIPSIGIGHQYAFQYRIPLATWDPAALLVLKYFAPADVALGLHWHHFDQPILPPIIPALPRLATPRIAKKIMVYLPNEEPRDVVRLLHLFSEYIFLFYTAVSQPCDDGNVRLRPYSRAAFIEDLLSCEGVITNAGFELASEALQVGKRLLVKPVAGQLEQTSNALALERLGLGSAMSSLDRDRIRAWLASPAHPRVVYPNVAQEIADWLGRGARDNLNEFTRSVWSQVDWPDAQNSLHQAIPALA
jgi:uncharacterized protein (TIGR00661 family)